MADAAPTMTRVAKPAAEEVVVRQAFAASRSGLPAAAARLADPAMRRRSVRPIAAQAPIQRVKIEGNNEDVTGDDAFKALLTGEGIEAATYAAELGSEAFTRLLASDNLYDSASHMLAEVKLRQGIVAAMRAINGNPNIGYNFGHDTMNMPGSHWEGMAAFKKGKVRPEEDDPDDWGAHAFRSKPGSKPSAAVAQVFNDGDENYALECNTAMLLAQYKGLLDMIGADTFDTVTGGQVTIMREWLTPTARSTADNQSEKLIPEQTLAKSDDEDDAFGRLVPGDGLYFVNFDDYETMHPDGAFAGEWCVYLGGGKVTGLGVEEMTFEQAVKKMISQYNVGLTANQKYGVDMGSREEARETPTLDGKVPGVARGIRRMANNENVSRALSNVNLTGVADD